MSLESRIERLEATLGEPVEIVVGWECDEHDNCMVVGDEHRPITDRCIRLRWPDE